MHIDPSSIKLVDGFKIRSTLDCDFGVFHSHSIRAGSFAPKYFIPQGEWWLDAAFAHDKDFFVKTEEFSVPRRIIGIPLRRKYEKTHLIKPGPVPNLIIKKERRRGLTIAFIDGNIVRQYIDPEFIFGGHDLVYSYIPKNEIWLEIEMNPKEIPFVFQHEFLERELMSKGKNYDVAHEYATIADKEARMTLNIGSYPGDANYRWRNLSNQDMAKKYYVHIRRPKEKSAQVRIAHAHEALLAIDKPVWAKLFNETIEAFKRGGVSR